MEKRKDDANIKSWVLLVFGLSGIGYQQWSGKVDWLLLLVFSVAAGIPGIANIFLLMKDSTTELQSSLSQQQHLESESDSSSHQSIEGSNE